MAYTELRFRDETRTKLLAGAAALADAVRATLAPESRSVLIEKKWGSPLVCGDGDTIAKAVKLEDAVKNLGAQLLSDATVQTSERVGDHAMFAEGLRNVVVGVSAIGITRGMDRGCEAAARSLQAISRPTKDKSRHRARRHGVGDSNRGPS